MEDYRNFNNEYPNTIPTTVSVGADTETSLQSIGTSYCVEASSTKQPGLVFHTTNSSNPEEGECPPPPLPNTMQAFNQSHCESLDTYTGSNDEAVITLMDSRGATRNYRVAKLEDGKCWMLDNLKLGSTTSTITLTSNDTNLASETSFTIPQVTTTFALEYNNPVVYGPVPLPSGVTSEDGPTNYGYLYNWSAATAGETTSSISTNSTAPHSICPAGWRLPTGGFGGDFSNLDILFGGTGNYASQGTTPAKWLYEGPFKGVLSGRHTASFNRQGSFLYLWTSSTHSSDIYKSFVTYIGPTYAYPGTYNDDRYDGYAVRCVL